MIDNADGDADYAFVGAHRKLYEHQGSVAIVQNGRTSLRAGVGQVPQCGPGRGWGG